MAQNGKPLPPQLDQNSTKELNLTVLQRMDRHVEDILTTAAHVTFYQFDTDASQWVGAAAQPGRGGCHAVDCVRSSVGK